MILFSKLKRKLTVIAVFLFLLQATDLYYCGEDECLLSGKSSDICKTAAFSLPDNNTLSHQPSDPDHDDCSQCVCCLSYSITNITSFSVTFIVYYFSIESIFYTPESVSLIDHIPRV